MSSDLLVINNRLNLTYIHKNSSNEVESQERDKPPFLPSGSMTDIVLNELTDKGICDRAGRLCAPGQDTVWQDSSLKMLALSFLNLSCFGWGNETLGKRLAGLIDLAEREGISLDCIRVVGSAVAVRLDDGVVEAIFCGAAGEQDILCTTFFDNISSLPEDFEIEIDALQATDQQLEEFFEVLEAYVSLEPSVSGEVRLKIGNYLCTIRNTRIYRPFARQCLALEISASSLSWNGRREQLNEQALEVSLIAAGGPLRQALFDLGFNLLNAVQNLEDCSSPIGEYLSETLLGTAVRDPSLTADCVNAVLGDEGDVGEIMAGEVEMGMEKMRIASDDAKALAGIALELHLRRCQSQLSYAITEDNYFDFWDCLFEERTGTNFQENAGLVDARFQGVAAPLIVFPWYLGGLLQICLCDSEESSALVKHEAMLKNNGSALQIRTFINQEHSLVFDHEFCLNQWIEVIDELIGNEGDEAFFLRELVSFLPRSVKLNRHCFGKLDEKQLKVFEECALKLLEADSLISYAAGFAFILVNYLSDPTSQRYSILLFKAIPLLISCSHRELCNLGLNVLEKLLNTTIDDEDFPEDEPIELIPYRIQCLAVSTMDPALCHDVLDALLLSPMPCLYPSVVEETLELLKKLTEADALKTLRLTHKLLKESIEQPGEFLYQLFERVFAVQERLMKQSTGSEILAPLVKASLKILMKMNAGNNVLLPQYSAHLNTMLRYSMEHVPDCALFWIPILRRACSCYPDLSEFEPSLLLECVRRSVEDPNCAFQNVAELCIDNAFKSVFMEGDPGILIEVLDKIHQGLDKEDVLKENLWPSLEVVPCKAAESWEQRVRNHLLSAKISSAQTWDLFESYLRYSTALEQSMNLEVCCHMIDLWDAHNGTKPLFSLFVFAAEGVLEQVEQHERGESLAKIIKIVCSRAFLSFQKKETLFNLIKGNVQRLSLLFKDIPEAQLNLLILLGGIQWGSVITKEIAYRMASAVDLIERLPVQQNSLLFLLQVLIADPNNKQDAVEVIKQLGCKMKPGILGKQKNAAKECLEKAAQYANEIQDPVSEKELLALAGQFDISADDYLDRAFKEMGEGRTADAVNTLIAMNGCEVSDSSRMTKRIITILNRVMDQLLPGENAEPVLQSWTLYANLLTEAGLIEKLEFKDAFPLLFRCVTHAHPDSNKQKREELTLLLLSKIKAAELTAPTEITQKEIARASEYAVLAVNNTIPQTIASSPWLAWLFDGKTNLSKIMAVNQIVQFCFTNHRESGLLKEMLGRETQSLQDLRSKTQSALSLVAVLRKINETCGINLKLVSYNEAIVQLRKHSSAVINVLLSLPERAEYLLWVIDEWGTFKTTAPRNLLQVTLPNVNALIFSILGSVALDQREGFATFCQAKMNMAGCSLGSLFREYILSTPEHYLIGQDPLFLILEKQLLAGWLTENELGTLINRFTKSFVVLADPKNALHCKLNTLLQKMLLMHVKEYICVESESYITASELLIKFQLYHSFFTQNGEPLAFVLNFLNLIKEKNKERYGDFLKCALRSCADFGENIYLNPTREKIKFFEFYLNCLTQIAEWIHLNKDTSSVFENELCRYLSASPMRDGSKEWDEEIVPSVQKLMKMISSYELVQAQRMEGYRLLFEGRGTLVSAYRYPMTS